MVKILKEWFLFYSEESKMTQKQVANFIHSCTQEFCKADD